MKSMFVIEEARTFPGLYSSVKYLTLEFLRRRNPYYSQPELAATFDCPYQLLGVPLELGHTRDYKY
jgi:hypothetical protein